jgi:16S rRNA processing protein RimM
VSTVTPTSGHAQDAQPCPEDAVEVGRVLGAWGIKGGIKVKAFAADPQALFSSKRWFIQPPETPRPPGARAAAALPTLLHVVHAKEHGDAVVATAQEIPDRNTAEALQGARVFVSRASFPTPDEDEFYWIDLIGLLVHNRADALLGQVVGLIETGPHCVLRIQPPGTSTDADEVLIPFVAAYVDKVDLPGKRVTVDWDFDF